MMKFSFLLSSLFPIIGYAQTSVTDTVLVDSNTYTIPHFPGEEKDLFKFLGKNVHYPPDAREKNIQGKVILQFIVNEDGSISDIQVVQSLSSDCDSEAIRVVKKMPRWIPGTKNGIPIKSQFKFPFSFKLATD